ncbi:EGF-like domain protein [Trichuris suis]|nr:EGF-like domain protein [Trichuris suis]
MSGYVCPGFGDMDIFSQTFTDALGVYQCITPVLKETYLKTLDSDEDESIFSMGDYCAKIYRNGGLEFLIFDEWHEFYLHFQEEWFSSEGLHGNTTPYEGTLRIHPGFEIQKPPKAISNSSGESSQLNPAAAYSIQTYEGGIRHSYSTSDGHISSGDLSLLWLAVKETFSVGIPDYPKCVALQLKKDAKNLEFSQPFKCKKNSGWDVFLCHHDAYRSCSAKAGKLLGQYFDDNAGNCSRKYSLNIINWEDLPYGRPCLNYVNESAECIDCMGNWGVWTDWSSVCDWAYRVRSRHSIKNPHADCTLPEALCCRQWSEMNKEPCRNFIRGASINLAKGNCIAGTKRIDTSGHYYCRCEYGSTGSLCQIKIKCPLFPCIYGVCKNERCRCTRGYTGILCEQCKVLFYSLQFQAVPESGCAMYEFDLWSRQ